MTGSFVSEKDFLPILHKYGLEYFFILDEGEHFLLRVELNTEIAERLKEDFDSLANTFWF